LGLVVLVVLILGFTVGWKGIKGFISPSNNVDAVADACSIACATNQKFSYCTEVRTIKISEEDDVSGSCKVLAGNSRYGIESCVDLCGPDDADDKDDDNDPAGELS